MRFIKPGNKFNTTVLTMTITLMTGTAFAETKHFPFQIAQTSAAIQQNGKYWIEKGWELHRAKKYDEAIQAWRKAEELGAGNDDLTFDIASTLEEMGRYSEAYDEVSKVRDSKNKDTRVEACEKMNRMKWARTKTLPKPYFADLATTIGWQRINDVGYIDMKGRFGITRNGKRPSKYYLFAKYSRDNRSGLVGGFPEEHFENSAVVGLGYEKKLLADESLYFFAEAGRAKELVDLGRDEYENDVRAGFEYYKHWYTDYDCHSDDKFPNRFVLKTHADLIYYSRYDDSLWFTAKVLPGIRVYEGDRSNVDAYLVFGVSENLRDSDESYHKAGLGIEWVPDRQRNFKVQVEATETYFDSGDSVYNVIVELEHYINW